MSHHDIDIRHTPAQTTADAVSGPRVDRRGATRVGLVALGTLLVGLRSLDAPLHEVVGWTTLLVGGWPVWSEAWGDVVARRMTMELSMSIAIAAAAAIGELFTALVITGFVLVAEILEEMTVDRGRRAIADLLDTLPRRVTVRRNGTVEQVPVEDLASGEVVLVEPGGRIPVDGTVVAGSSFVDQATVTGESMPAEKTIGDGVFAGTVNLAGTLDIRVEGVGADTTYGRIIHAVAEAENTRAPVQRLADRLAGYLVYFALAAAALTYLVTRDIIATISVVIVAGACGIAAGTPLAILGGIGRAARNQAIIKGGVHLETLGKVDTFVLDKTGTLTFGHPRVIGALTFDGITEEDLIETAATAELRSEHPVGKAIVAYATENGVPVAEPDVFTYTPGQGVSVSVGEDEVLVGNPALLQSRGIEIPDGHALPAGATHAYITRNGTPLGVISVADTMRTDASQAIAALKARGFTTILLTGDNQDAADAVGTQLGIDNVEAELLPHQKLQRIETLVGQGRVVAMVGDGINDAPALAVAHVGIAMGSGTVVAHETADVILIGNDLTRLVDTIDLARHTRHIIFQNLGGTIGVDVAGIGLAAAGLLNPVLAALIHVVSELAFLANSARLIPTQQDNPAGRPREST